MSRLFLIDKEKSYSYAGLLADVNAATKFVPNYKNSDLYSVFLNLIIAIVHCQKITMLDSDLSLNEISDIPDVIINKTSLLDKTHFKSEHELIQAILCSSSMVTIYTSGTTGQPKKVAHSIETLTRGVKLSEKHKDKTWAFAYNPTHMAGLQVFFQAIGNQNTLVNVFNIDREKVLDYFEKYEISHISATPSFYRLMLPIKNPLLKVNQVTLGGEKSDDKLFKLLRALFPNARLSNIYASTEAGTLFVANGDYFKIPKQIREKIKFVENELFIHSSLLGQSSDFKLKEDYYPSGDLIEWVNEKDGVFKFVSRKNELINVGGYKVNPSEVEMIINQISGIANSKVYGKPNSLLGNIICADIIKENHGDEISEIYIKKHLAEKLQDFKIPRKIYFVDKLSLTRTGKIKR